MLAACSTADYAEPVNTFAAASGEAEKALVSLNDSVTKGYADYVRDLVMRGDGQVEFTEHEPNEDELVGAIDCGISSERCQLMVVLRDETTEQLTPDDALADMVAIMAGIRAYADNLTTIVAADNAAAASTDISATFGSIQNLANIVATRGGSEAAAALPDFAEPAAAAANWLVGQYVESVKLAGLREATAAAQPVIVEAADVFKQASDVAQVVPRKILSAEVQDRYDIYLESKTEANLDRLIAAAEAYDTFLVANPPEVFLRLRDAHGALTESLNNGDLTLAAAMGKIEVFANEAIALAEIMKDLSGVLASAPEGDS